MDNNREDLRTVIAGNITELRKNAGFTQVAFAEKLNYSDKAVSKWERGESIPDVVVLKEIADIFGVTVDYLLKSEHTVEEIESVKPIKKRNRLFISMGSIGSVWLFATFIFMVLSYLPFNIPNKWLVFVFTIPVTALLILIFNAIWGKKSLTWFTVSLLEWSILVATYVSLITLINLNTWLIFIVGVPMQLVTLFFCSIRKK